MMACEGLNNVKHTYIAHRSQLAAQGMGHQIAPESGQPFCLDRAGLMPAQGAAKCLEAECMQALQAIIKAWVSFSLPHRHEHCMDCSHFDAQQPMHAQTNDCMQLLGDLGAHNHGCGKLNVYVR